MILIVLATWPASALASTDEQRIAAHLHTAESYFPAAANCTSRTVHLRADAAIDAAHHTDMAVEGMATLGGTPGYMGPCDVWLRANISAHNFYVDLFHELAHTAGWEDGAAMDVAVNRALDLAMPPSHRAKSSRRRGRRVSAPNRRWGIGRLPRPRR